MLKGNLERAEMAFSEEQALAMEQKLRTAKFTFEDFIEQLHIVRQMGPMEELLGMIPGLQQVSRQIPTEVTEKGLVLAEAIINSMTVEERQSPRVINASRKRRIARGSGTTVQQVNQLLKQFSQMQGMMRQLQGGRGRGLMSLLR